MRECDGTERECEAYVGSRHGSPGNRPRRTAGYDDVEGTGHGPQRQEDRVHRRDRGARGKRLWRDVIAAGGIRAGS